MALWIDKAEKHAAAKKFDFGVLLTSRLAPDMKDFIYQLQSACDYVKGGAAWLSALQAMGVHGIFSTWTSLKIIVDEIAALLNQEGRDR